jgi:predicted Zn-dependent protease
VAAATAAGEAIEDDTTAMAVQTGAVLGASAATAGYSREHEDQADRVGLRYAYEAGYDVTQGPALWQRFARKYGESGAAVNFFFGDHSRSSKRAELLRQQIRYNY